MKLSHLKKIEKNLNKIEECVQIIRNILPEPEVKVQIIPKAAKKRGRKAKNSA